jgi:hypothetical protein
VATTNKRDKLWAQAISLFTFLTSDTTALAVTILDATGAPITSFGGSGGTSSTFGSAFPASGTAIGALDSTGVNMAALNLDNLGQLKVAGSFSSAPVSSTTSTLSNVSESATSVTVLAANTNRLTFSLYNDSDSAVCLKFGTTASATSFSYRLLARGALSTADIGVNYVGKIDAIWDSTPGTAGHSSMRIGELTA